MTCGTQFAFFIWETFTRPLQFALKFIPLDSHADQVRVMREPFPFAWKTEDFAVPVRKSRPRALWEILAEWYTSVFIALAQRNKFGLIIYTDKGDAVLAPASSVDINLMVKDCFHNFTCVMLLWSDEIFSIIHSALALTDGKNVCAQYAGQIE